MHARMANPALSVPGAMKALVALAKCTEHEEVPPVTQYLVHLRASQINGCSVCVVMHSEELRKAEQSEDRIAAVAAWREAPFFTDAERAALALTESVTRLADRSDAVPDDVWDEAAKHYSEPALGALVLTIGMINIWNRINASTRQVAGAF